MQKNAAAARKGKEVVKKSKEIAEKAGEQARKRANAYADELKNKTAAVTEGKSHLSAYRSARTDCTCRR